MSNNLNTQKILSDIVVYNKYAKFNPNESRRETWEEIVDRYKAMLIKKYVGEYEDIHDIPKDKFDLYEDIVQNCEYIYNKKILPSMRALQFAGPAIEKNEARGYNCSYMPMDDYRAFSELMFLLLGGTGAGYSVQYHHVEKLPGIQHPTKRAKYLIGDSIEGWSDAVKQLMKAYFGKTKVGPRFDYSDIREKGARLVTAGGKAPGPEPLRIALTHIESILKEKQNGDNLTPFEVHRICCLIADAVLAGGIRRAALISLFSMDDKVMATCKYGTWWEKYPELGRANNSASILRNRIKKNEFDTFWKMIVDSNSGEPGIYFTNDPEYGTNPCCEISLRPFTFCNLTEINAGTITGQEDLNDRAKIAGFFGTLQAGITDFHYLRNIWKVNTEKDALIGIGITGVGDGKIEDLDWTKSAKIGMEENSRVAKIIGINEAARATTIKPAGTTSCVVGTASGAHAWHGPQYIRNMQCRVGDDLYNFFTVHHNELIQVMEYDPMSAVIGIPQKAPEGAILREDETAIDFLERVKRLNVEWVHPGHRRGPNTNNVSATVSVKEHEWDEVGEWMWKNRHKYNGLSVLPFDGGTYKNAPFQEVSEEVFNRKLNYIINNPIDLTLISEEEDNTTQKDTVACAGGSCEII
jgi:ribonucleoside-triphosphate reductase